MAIKAKVYYINWVRFGRSEGRFGPFSEKSIANEVLTAIRAAIADPRSDLSISDREINADFAFDFDGKTISIDV